MYTREGAGETFQYQFSDQAIDVIRNAAEEARGLQHNYIGTEHLLLGLAKYGLPALESLGVDYTQVRTQIEYFTGKGDRMVLIDIGFTPRAKRVIQLSVDEARRHRDELVLPEHLLLGLAREGEGIAVGLLESLGVRLDRVFLLTRFGQPIAKAVDSLDRLRSFLVDPNQDIIRKEQIGMILEGALGLISPKTINKRKTL